MWFPPGLGNDTALLQLSGRMAHSLISKFRKSVGSLFFVIGSRVSRDDRLVDLSIMSPNFMETGVTHMDS